jgi:hypothetical protein
VSPVNYNKIKLLNSINILGFKSLINFW